MAVISQIVINRAADNVSHDSKRLRGLKIQWVFFPDKREILKLDWLSFDFFPL